MNNQNICTIILYVVLLLPNVATFESESLCNDATFNRKHFCHCEMISSEMWDVPVFTTDCSFQNIINVQSNMTLDNMEKLDLSLNNITVITENNFFKGRYLKILNLNSNIIGKISVNSFTNIPNLQQLDLSCNELTQIEPGIFYGIYKLEMLNLASNKLASFQQFTFNSLPILKYVSLSRNPLGKFISNSSNIFSANGPSLNPKLEALILEDIGIDDFPSSFLDPAYNLRELCLAHNPIKVFPVIPYTVETLDVSSTLIAEILPKHLVNLPGLKVLKLNNLSYLKNISDYTFHPLKGLLKLELQNCRNLSTFSVHAFGRNIIEDVDYDFPLKEISFRGSGLTRLSPLLEPLFAKLTDLDLEGNPWNCDCELDWIRKLNIDEEYKEHVRCFKPRHLYNHQLFVLRDNQLICETFNSRLAFFGNSLLVIMCLILTGLAIWLVFLWPKYKERRYMLQKSLSPASPYSRITIEPNRAEEIS